MEEEGASNLEKREDIKSYSDDDMPMSAPLGPHVRPFKDKHDPLLQAVWDISKDEIDKNKKLKPLMDLLEGANTPSKHCDILHEETGKPVAQATPLIIACFEGDRDTIEYLLQRGADANQTESEHNLTAIHILCDADYFGQRLSPKDRADVLYTMIQRGVDVNHLDKNYVSALHKAVIHNRIECVEELLRAGANPNCLFNGDTPLSIAARHNRKRICQLLLSYPRTDMNLINEQGGTALHFAAAALHDNAECLQLLLSAGSNINALDLRNNTPAMVAAFFNKPVLLQSLINAGADLSVRNVEGKDAWDVAVDKDHRACIDLLARQLNRQPPPPQPSKDDAVSQQLAAQVAQVNL